MPLPFLQDTQAWACWVDACQAPAAGGWQAWGQLAVAHSLNRVLSEGLRTAAGKVPAPRLPGNSPDFLGGARSEGSARATSLPGRGRTRHRLVDVDGAPFVLRTGASLPSRGTRVTGGQPAACPTLGVACAFGALC